MGSAVYADGIYDRGLVQLFPGGAQHRLRDRQGQADHDDRIQRGAGGHQDLPGKGGVPAGETCYAVHAEQNAIVQAAKLGVSIDGATLYCTHQPCSMCCKMIINSGIKRVIYKEGYPDPFTLELFAEAGVKLERYEDEISH